MFQWPQYGWNFDVARSSIWRYERNAGSRWLYYLAIIWYMTAPAWWNKAQWKSEQSHATSRTAASGETFTLATMPMMMIMSPRNTTPLQKTSPLERTLMAKVEEERSDSEGFHTVHMNCLPFMRMLVRRSVRRLHNAIYVRFGIKRGRVPSIWEETSEQEPVCRLMSRPIQDYLWRKWLENVFRHITVSERANCQHSSTQQTTSARKKCGEGAIHIWKDSRQWRTPHGHRIRNGKNPVFVWTEVQTELKPNSKMGVKSASCPAPEKCIYST